MPRLKHFVVEKSKLITWYFEKVPAKEIAARLNWDVSTVHRIIRQNQGLPITVTPLLPKKRAGCPRHHTHVQEDWLQRSSPLSI